MRTGPRHYGPHGIVNDRLTCTLSGEHYHTEERDTMAHNGDTIRSYRIGLENEQFDEDLSAVDRQAVAYLLGVAERIAYNFGGTPASDLVRMAYDPMGSSAEVNARVAEIIRGCCAH